MAMLMFGTSSLSSLSLDGLVVYQSILFSSVLETLHWVEMGTQELVVCCHIHGTGLCWRMDYLRAELPPSWKLLQVWFVGLVLNLP